MCERKVERATKNAEEGKEEVGKSRKNVLEARSIKNFKQESPAWNFTEMFNKIRAS